MRIVQLDPKLAIESVLEELGISIGFGNATFQPPVLQQCYIDKKKDRVSEMWRDVEKEE